jgi:polygalacturonase
MNIMGNKNYRITDFGAKSGNHPEYAIQNAGAIQAAIDSCADHGGGCVIIPSGAFFYTAPFSFKSNLNFILEPGSCLKADPDESHYTRSAFRANKSEGTIWIGAENAENVMISGTGTIDGNGPAFMGPEEKAAFALKPITDVDLRPHIMTLVGCKHLTIRDVTIRHAAYWGVHLAGCEDVVISGVRLYNHLKIRNSDGIDLDHCKNCRISDCYIESGDDCICLKNRREYAEFGACENITVTNCSMTSTSCAFKIGSENMDVIRNVLVTNCIITKSNRGIGIQNRDEGSVENVRFAHLIIQSRLFDNVWWGKAEPIYITAFRRAAAAHRDANWRFAPGQTEGRVGDVKDIWISNCTCDAENGVYIAGEPGKIARINLENITLTLNKISTHPGGWWDRRPCAVPGLLEAPTAGFAFHEITQLLVRNCSIRWGPNRPSYYRNAVEYSNIDGFKLENFDGTPIFNNSA